MIASAPAELNAVFIITMFINVVAGLGVFLLGMKYMSEGLQTIAGRRLRKMIGAATGNRFSGMAVGTGVTCLVQSSSVTTVMVVGFVTAGFMTLTQAIGVIIGANIGTTITGWILALRIGKYGLPIMGVAALVFRFANKDRLKFLAMATMGMGMIFFGLELMKNGFKPIRGMESFEAWFSTFNANSYPGVLKCAAVGCVLTMIVQSSSATLGITIGLATTGVIPFHTAAALVLGENIGTTITAYLASIGTTTNAKRAAYAHVVFNVIGVIWITALFRPYIYLVEQVIGIDPHAGTTVVEGGKEVVNFPHVTAAIAAVHTGFNVANTLLFLPFTNHLAALLTRFVPDRDFKETPHLTMLDANLSGTPVIGIEQSRKEVNRMADTLDKMLPRLREVISNGTPDEKNVQKIFHKEEVLDIMQKEVTVFVTDLLAGSLTLELADEGRRIVRIADEYESAGDYVQNLLKLYLRLEQADLKLSRTDRDSMLELHDEVAGYVDLVSTACRQNRPEVVTKAHSTGEGISHHVRRLRNQHLAEVADTRPAPLVTVIYTDMLNAYRRVKDHALNVAEALAGEK
ncbi:MAG: Na/Pi cotransporter family protein [Phycisphaerae bacterium]|jgi:phosphate:Na+ symporter|nr:Na/Pi cotransporter family protein [Phycisphaerae bacterium]